MFATLAGMAIVNFESVNVSMSWHGPQNELLVAKPTVSWQVWPEGDNVVSGVTVSINGKKQKASYNSLTKSVVHTPTEPLPPGQHSVHAQVVINGWAKFDKKWTFKVLPEAVQELPQPSDASLSVIDAFNDVRKTAGLQNAIVDPVLCLSSIAHARYLELHPGGGHIQTENRPSFTARTPAERMSKMGYSGGSWEILVQNTRDAETAIKRLFDAPYHRVAMLNSGSIRAGGAFVGGTVVVNGEISSEVKTVVSPADQQTDVQPFWKDNESPDPMRIHSFKSRMVGYPIMFVRQGSRSIHVRKFELRSSNGTKIEAWENFPGYDEHVRAEAFIMPKTPLAPGATYNVHVEATDDQGKEIGTNWSFTTATSNVYALSTFHNALGISSAVGK